MSMISAWYSGLLFMEPHSISLEGLPSLIIESLVLDKHNTTKRAKEPHKKKLNEMRDLCFHLRWWFYFQDDRSQESRVKWSVKRRKLNNLITTVRTSSLDRAIKLLLLVLKMEWNNNLLLEVAVAIKFFFLQMISITKTMKIKQYSSLIILTQDTHRQVKKILFKK